MCDEPKNWRIRLPNDYLIQPGMQHQITDAAASQMLKSSSLDDWALIMEAQARFAAARVADDLLRENVLRDMLYMDYKPPTKWQRRWTAIKRFPGRVRDAWKVLTGEAWIYDD